MDVAWRCPPCPLARPSPPPGPLGAATCPSAPRHLTTKETNVTGLLPLEEPAPEGHFSHLLWSFSGPVGELGTINGVLVKFSWDGAT